MYRKHLAAAAMLGFAAMAPGAALAAGDLHSMSWDEIVAQAKEEGEVNWYVWYFQPRYRELAAAFTETYGITVNIPEGTHQGSIDTMLAERGRDTGDIDILAMGAERIDTFDHEAILFGPIRDILPGGEKLIDDLGGYEGHDYAFAYWGNQTGIAYDPEAISEDMLPQTVAEVGAYWQENPGRFGFNYENGGSGPSFIQNMARNIAPDVDFGDGEVTDAKLAGLQPVWDWFLENTDGYVITASNTDSLVRLSGREFALVPAWEDHLFKLQLEGEVDERIKFYIPDWGMNGGGNVNVIPQNAPHPAAALLFMSWVSSAETQTKFNQVFGAAPMHPDADDSFALVPNAMRANSRNWTANPFGEEIKQAFIENVALER